MTNERNAFKAGLFILFGIAAIIGVVIAIRGVGQFLQPMQYATVSFDLSDDIGGLSTGDEVRVGGAKVGVVRSVALVDAPQGQHKIFVNFSIPRRFILHKNAAVAIQSTVTGVSVLNFSSLGSGELLTVGESLEGRPAALTAFLASGTEIRNLIADVRKTTLPKLDTVLDKATDTLVVYRQAGQNAGELVSQIKGKLDPIVDRYFGVADAAKNAMTQAGDIFGDSKLDIRSMMANLNAATGTFRDKLPGLMDQADAVFAKVSHALDGATQALEDVKQVAANTKDVTASARTLLVTNRSRIDAMVTSLKTTGENLKNASAEIRRSPWRLLYQPKPGEMNNLNLYDSARQFAEGANDLNDAAEALRDALKDPKVEKAQVEKLVEKLDKSFTNFHEAEDQLWQLVKE